MPDKKLTDSEIIKALEEWRKEIIADYQRLQLLDVPMDCFEESHADTVTNLSNALDLINRLQAKNSNLISDLTSLQNDLTSAKAENERLKKGWKADVILTANVKAEAVTEFAESLKSEIKALSDKHFEKQEHNICEALETLNSRIESLLKNTVS